jgi:peptide/nickel transport system substrate-binding protein
VEAVDPMTVRVKTSQPTPILPRLLVPMPIMNRAWAVKNGAERPSNNTRGIQSYASDNSNGTGPFKIVERKPDVMTRFAVHAGWWDKVQHNITTAVFQPIKSAGTRQAALISGQVDMIWPVPLSDIDRLKAVQGVEVDSIASEWDIMLRFNFADAELRSSDVKGKNPFHDIRVREAVYRAIDINAINRAVMRGLARPTALPIAPTINGYDASLDNRPKADLARAKQLLAEAGYPNGFSFAIHVPNDRYLNDEAIGSAVAPMLARAGLKVTVVSQARARHFAMAAKGETDFYMQGTATATLKDGFEALSLLFHTSGATAGSSNYGKYSNPEVDALIAKLTAEGDPAARRRIMSETFAVLQKEWAFVPLHIQPSVWAMRKGFRPLHLPDDAVRLWRVQVD